MHFVHQAAAGRVVFGAGRASELGDEIALLGLGRVLVLTTPGQRQRTAAIVASAGAEAGARIAGTFDRAAAHVPAALVAEALGHARALGADGLLAIGGGSTIGLAKALARKTRWPSLAVPTTYSGSEMTRIFGVTRDGEKTTGRDLGVRPRTVVYDAALTLDLPLAVSARSGLNAMAHAFEALYADDASPLTALTAEEALAALAQGLPAIAAGPRDLGARERVLYGAWLAGLCLDGASMGLHHKLCHVLGGTFDLPHADVHALVLPHALAYNAPAAPAAMQRATRALGIVAGDGAGDVATAVYRLAERLGVATSLAALGMRAADLARAADLTVARPYANPRPVDRDAVLALLERAYAGAPPATA